MYAIILVFIAGYVAIAFEHPLKISKTASAIITGVLCWTIYILSSYNKEIVNEELLAHLGDIASILFFLMGAMTIVELIDQHDGFSTITGRIKTRNKGVLILIISILAFFLSALLDNLTTTIVMLSMVRKLLSEKEDRWRFAGLIIIAANAGGAWSPLGDVTTTMLWIGGQITAANITLKLIFPSLVCALLPTLYFWFRYRKERLGEWKVERKTDISPQDSTTIFYTGILCLLFVPLFKTLTHLPPFMGMMLSLGIIWLVESTIHRTKDKRVRESYSVYAALERIDVPSILFFLGILLAVASLEFFGLLSKMAVWLTNITKSETGMGIALGLLSAIVDNVPLVAAAQGMYSLQTYPTDHFLWELLAFTTGTGGSAIIIGSAAGVAAMGIEQIEFIWYLKKISWLALIGFFAGTLAYLGVCCVF